MPSSVAGLELANCCGSTVPWAGIRLLMLKRALQILQRGLEVTPVSRFGRPIGFAQI